MSKWTRCKDQLPAKSDEDERHELWTAYKEKVARNNSTFCEMFVDQFGDDFYWMRTNLKRPEPPQ